MITTILNAPWWAWILGIIILVFLFLVFRLLINWYIKKGEREDALMREENAKKEVTRQLILGPSDFYNSSEDVFINEKNKNLIIRILNLYDRKTLDKDKFVFASSLPLYFDKRDETLLLMAISQLVSVSAKTHELIIEKSAAVSLDYELKEKILNHLFLHLSKIYAYMIEPQSVLIAKNKDYKDCLYIYLKTPLKYHLWLRERLFFSKGICSIDDFNNDDIYNFAIWKEQKENWENILPIMKGIITDYFKAGVEFSDVTTN